MRITRLAAALLPLMLSPAAFARDFVLTDTSAGIEQANWTTSSAKLGIKSATPFSITKTTLHGGRQEGSTLITIDTGNLKLQLIPTRGMGLYRASSGDVTLGWNSPVDEIVHPSFINLEQRGGLGWLDGFNELMVRCGYEWTGHPGTENGRLMSLHGRAQNIPASKVVVSVEEKAPYRITVKGLVKEKTFKFSDLETWAGVSVVPGEKTFRVHDELTNKSDYERDYQIIYHSNFGAPILEGGAHFSAAIEEISPFNDYAKKGLADWPTYLPATPGYDEMVFNIKPYADADGKTLAMLSNKAGDRGVAVGFNVQQLPVLTLWKNTDSVKQGYVTGIEPGTSYAYPRQIERAQGRIAKLAPGATQRFDLEYRILGSAADVRAAQSGIDAIQAGREVRLNETPMAKE
ncbi:aldose 1-epimerase family protein [Niveibacterium terrae]|uniref:aldose 1-epimerase family protein n=1 Tax=Niveibacterium terrae TaxID=3373598 RepID=UPI003A91108E